MSEILKRAFSQISLIRHFEIRAEAAYQQGKIGGFFHAYIGQEAIQAAAVEAFGPSQWYTTSYRCHALALLLGESPDALMAELFGRETGNAKGRGGSMHFFSDKLLGGFGIVGGQVPIATGAGFSLKYLKEKGLSICFLGDGAVAQGAFHEALNLASLWSLPCIYIIENNRWGMGTPVEKAICVPRLAEDKAAGYNMKGYTLDGMNFLECYNAFKTIGEEVKATNRPVLIEVLTERFKGHSISDPGLYRTKEVLKEAMTRDPLALLRYELVAQGVLTEEEVIRIDKESKERVLQSLAYAEASPYPSLETLEKGVLV